MSSPRSATPPRVSLGLPVYNAGAYLSETLESLLGQTYEDFEVVISDNASTDGTREMCEEFAGRDPRIRFFEGDVNRGAAWNYNRVFALSQGEFFKWAAADDLCKPQFLELCMEAFERNPDAVLSYPRTTIINAEGDVVEDYDDRMHLGEDAPEARFVRVVRALREANAVFGLVRRSVLKQTRLIGPYTSSDLVLLGELALRGKFVEVEQRLFLRRSHAGQSMQVHPDARERAQWFDPKRREVGLPTWRLFSEYARAIRSAPITGRQQRRCRWALLWLLRNKYLDLGRDLWVYALDRLSRRPA